MIGNNEKELIISLTIGDSRRVCDALTAIAEEKPNAQVEEQTFRMIRSYEPAKHMLDLTGSDMFTSDGGSELTRAVGRKLKAEGRISDGRSEVAALLRKRSLAQQKKVNGYLYRYLTA